MPISFKLLEVIIKLQACPTTVRYIKLSNSILEMAAVELFVAWREGDGTHEYLGFPT